MASKRTVSRRRANKHKKARAAYRAIVMKARTEVTKLLRRNSAGTITRRELQTGLKEVKGGLKRMLVHKKALL